VGVSWAADGRSFFVLHRQGLLQRIGYPVLKELRRIELKQECHALGVCKLGLMLTLEQLQEIWIVDPDTLQVVKRHGVGQLRKALSGPGLAVAYAFCRDAETFRPSANGLPVRVDLTDGTLAAMTLAADPTGRAVPGLDGFEYAALSPDGKWLFADGFGLLRYRIEDATLTPDGRTREGMGGGAKTGICISPDSKWVCFPTGGGNDGLTYGTYVYLTDDLSRPAFTLQQGAYPEVVGFDHAGKRLFGQNAEYPLIVFDANGTKRGEYKFGPTRGLHNVKQFAAHPTVGRVLLLRTNDQLLLVEFAASE
jgi:hypothetical protein